MQNDDRADERDDPDFAALARALFPERRLVRAWRLTGGVSASTHALEVRGDDGRAERVVVRQSSAADFKVAGAISATLEHQLLNALHGLGLPVARPRHVDTRCAVLQRPYVVYDFVDSDPTGPAPMQMADEMASVLARVHGVDLDRIPAELPERDSPLPELGAWVETDVHQRASRAFRGGRPRALLHGDYWPGNLLWRGGAIVALVDWEDAALGDPLSDLAAARLELSVASSMDVAERFARRYLEQTGIDPHELAVWELYVSAAALASMDDWGLPPAVLSRRKRTTREYYSAALARLE